MIKESGFHNTYFYYPYPDYKLPTVIYSQDVLPSKKDTINSENFRDYSSADKNTLIANEKKLYTDIVENGVFEFFCKFVFGGVLRQQSARGNNVCEINKRTQGTISNGNKIYEG